MRGNEQQRGAGQSGLVRAVLLLFLALPSLANAAWPVKNFEVFVGYPLIFEKNFYQEPNQALGELTDIPAQPSIPLRPEIKAEIEMYLREVAEVLEKDFPAPLWNEPVTRSDGSRALRLYYYDYDMVEDILGVRTDTTELAGYKSDCGSVDETITINAKQFLKQSGGSSLSAKNYADLAHELFHAVQAATAAGDPCGPKLGEWATEGQAEAFGQDMARELRGKTVSTQQTRWGLRSYHFPLYTTRRHEGGKRQSYQTSSFWRYLAERHALRRSGKSGAQGLPGPDIPTGYDTDYSYLVSMMDQAFSGTGARAAMNWLDVGLEVEFNLGLRRIFAEFSSVFADYGSHRVKGSSTDKQARWINAGLAGDVNLKGTCKRVPLGTAFEQRDATISLELEPNSAGCVELVVGNTLGPQTWIVQTTSPTPEQTRHLALSMAGGQQLQTSALIDVGTSDGTMANWIFDLDSNKTQYLVVNNMAKLPGQTKKQRVKLRLTLTGHDSPPPSSPPPKRSAPKQKSVEPRPGPAGAEAAKTKRHAEREIGPNGVDAVNWNRVEPSGCGAGTDRLGCEGGVRITLGLDGSALMVPLAGDALGGMMTDMMYMGAALDPTNPASMAKMQEIAVYEDWASSTPGTQIELILPGVDFGFTGPVNQAGITVSGNNGVGQRYSASTTSKTPNSPCNYSPATGTVVIEEFSREVIRGRYQAPLVEIPYISPGRQERCKNLSVVQRIEGEFILAAPWLADDRMPFDASWIEEDMVNDLGEMMPGLQNLDLDAITPDDSSAPPPAQSDASGGYEPDALDEIDDLDPSDCDCSCAAMEESQRLMEEMSNSGQIPQTAEAFTSMMCVRMCMMQGQGLECN